MPTSGSGGPVTPWSFGQNVGVASIENDRQGNVLLAGAYDAYLKIPELGLSVRPEDETVAGFVVKLSPAGERIWIWIGDAMSVESIAVDDCGNTFVALVETTDPPTGVKDVFTLAKLDSEGHEIWRRAFPPEPYFSPDRLLVDAHGDVVLYGAVQGLLELVDDGSPHVGVSTGFVAGFSGATGKGRWTKTIAGNSGVGMALDPAGDVVVLGDFLKIGDTTIAASASADGSVAIVRLDASGGVKSIARTGPAPDFHAADLVMTPQGDVGASGKCAVANNEPQWCMARFAAGGAPAVRQIVGKKNISNESARVAFDAQGNLLLLSQTYDLQDPVTPYSEHLYLTRMSVTGEITRAEDWRSGGTVAPAALHVDPAGGILFAATTGLIAGAAIDVGDGPKSPTIVARLAP